MAEAPQGSGAMIARLRWLGRVLVLMSLLFGGVFVVLARRSAATGESGQLASALFWAAAVLQFAVVFVLLRPAALRWRSRRG